MRRPVLALVALVLLAGCGDRLDFPTGLTHPDPAQAVTSITPLHDGTTHDGAVPEPGVADPTNHVTGTYPAHCTATTDPAGHWHPDPACTPGLVRRDITDANTASTICRSGYTSNPANPGARPSAANTAPVKRAAMAAYGIPASAASTTELDHLVPLELAGGNGVENLAPEPSDEPGHGVNNSKDDVENALHAAVCAHRVRLSDTQVAIATDWTTAEARLGVTAKGTHR